MCETAGEVHPSCMGKICPASLLETFAYTSCSCRDFFSCSPITLGGIVTLSNIRIFHILACPVRIERFFDEQFNVCTTTEYCGLPSTKVKFVEVNVIFN
jgi:hypothetical protein